MPSTRNWLARPSWLVAAGSLPAGAPDDFYARITEAAVGLGVPVAIDTSGPALAAAIDAGATVVKPNLEELQELIDTPLITVGDVVDAARQLRARGCKDLLVSLGGHGALLITAEGSWWAGGPPLVPRSTVGAGDSHALRLPAHRRHTRRTTCRGGGLGPGRVPASRQHRSRPARNASLRRRRPRRRRSRSPPSSEGRRMTDLITEDLVVLDLVATDKADATRQLAQKLQAAGRVTDLEGFLADVAAREAQMATGMPGGIGLPHARSEHVTVPSLGLARVPAGVDFGAPDGPATLVFLIAAPAGGGSEHLTILAALARRLVRPAFRQTIIDAPDAASVASYVQGEVGGQ